MFRSILAPFQTFKENRNAVNVRNLLDGRIVMNAGTVMRILNLRWALFNIAGHIWF